MATGTLYDLSYNTRSIPAKAVAAIAGIKLDLVTDFTMGESNKTPEYLAKFPLGKIPAIEMSNGFKLFEAGPIARYLAGLAPNSGLLGKTPEEGALVDQWIHATEFEVCIPGDLIKGMLFSHRIPYNKPTHTWLVDKQMRAIEAINTHLLSNTFLVGERLTLADLQLAKDVQNACSIALDATLRTKYSNVVRHMNTVINHPSLKGIFPETKAVDKAAIFVPPKKEEKVKAPKEDKPKAEKKPKAKEVDEEEDEPSAPPEPKVKNPLDDLPKSTLNLEDWKRAYSNKDTRGADGAIEWFYQNYDKEGFSVWRVDFKYNAELTQTFMSSNQITGFFNRLEASRKYLFASVGVLGTSNDSIISGTIICRGQDVVPVVNVAPDYESYVYTKMDLANEDDKKFFEGALAWDLVVDGKAWVDGKNFK